MLLRELRVWIFWIAASAIVVLIVEWVVLLLLKLLRVVLVVVAAELVWILLLLMGLRIELLITISRGWWTSGSSISHVSIVVIE